MTIPASSQVDVDAIELVVAEDGSVPAAQLARLGVQPGTRLRVVPTPSQTPRRRRRRLEGALAGKVSGTALTQALHDTKASRTAAVDRDLS